MTSKQRKAQQHHPPTTTSSFSSNPYSSSDAELDTLSSSSSSDFYNKQQQQQQQQQHQQQQQQQQQQNQKKDELASDNDNNTNNERIEKGDCDWNVQDVRNELRKATIVLSHYSLKLASKWAAELLTSLPVTTATTSMNTNEEYNAPIVLNSNDDVSLYAKSLLDLGEYEHAASVLSSPTSSSSNDHKSSTSSKGIIDPKSQQYYSNPLPNLTSYGIFIRGYALYLAGEQRKEEEIGERKSDASSNGTKDPQQQQSCTASAVNQNLNLLERELEQYHYEERLDSFGYYLYGIVLKALYGNTSTAKNTRNKEQQHESYDITVHSILIQSILLYPYNWSAWLDLANYCVDNPHLHSTVETSLSPLSNQYMYHFFLLYVFKEQEQNKEALFIIESRLTPFFQDSLFLKTMTASVYYYSQSFPPSLAIFQSIRAKDPYTLDDMDIYSNILYVNEDKAALSQLAHSSMLIDKYSPVTCCIVGNYYSLKRNHEKAVQYFSRALKLNRTYLCAWTLMGHEFIEMKNVSAAIEAYRQAVDINPRDYRAWYGLGQTYEMFNMLFYALYYYQKAATLRPYDPRMWCALGECYRALQKPSRAIQAYERAVSHYDREGVATRKLATLYKEVNKIEKAANCFIRYLQIQFQTDDIFSEDLISNTILLEPNDAEALLFLAYYYKNHRNYSMSTKCCERLLEYPGPEKEESKALLREIRSRMDRYGGSGISGARRTIETSFDFSP